MTAVKIDGNGSIQLPPRLRRRFQVGEELAIFGDGNTIVLKRLAVAAPTEIAERAPGVAPSLREITAEIHRMRTERTKARGHAKTRRRS